MIVYKYFWYKLIDEGPRLLKPSNVLETVQNVFQYSMKSGKIQLSINFLTD
jgi:hypothetical protein